MSFYWLALGILGVWRVTHMLASEDGPWNLWVRLRRAAGNGFWGELLDCIYCLSLWVALPFAVIIGSGAAEIFCLWLGLSAGALIVERLTEHRRDPPPAVYFDAGSAPDGLLRKEAGSMAENGRGARADDAG
jgi:hypothetical protein